MMELLIEKLAELTEEDKEAVAPDKSLAEFAAWDSLAKVSFLATALTEFGVELDGPDLENAETVRDLYQLILDAKNADE